MKKREEEKDYTIQREMTVSRPADVAAEPDMHSYDEGQKTESCGEAQRVSQPRRLQNECAFPGMKIRFYVQGICKSSIGNCCAYRASQGTRRHADSARYWLFPFADPRLPRISSMDVHIQTWRPHLHGDTKKRLLQSRNSTS